MTMIRRRALSRDIAVLLTVKIILLAVIYALVFAPRHADGGDAAVHILGRSAAVGSER